MFFGCPHRSSMIRLLSAALRSCSFFSSSAAFFLKSNYGPEKKKQKKIVVRHRKRRGGVKERKISFIKKFHFCCNDTTSDLKRGVGVGTRVENRIQADNWGQHDDNNRVIINTFGIRRKWIIIRKNPFDLFPLNRHVHWFITTVFSEPTTVRRERLCRCCLSC